jgi:hypothetical protein
MDSRRGQEENTSRRTYVVGLSSVSGPAVDIQRALARCRTAASFCRLRIGQPCDSYATPALDHLPTHRDDANRAGILHVTAQDRPGCSVDARARYDERHAGSSRHRGRHSIDRARALRFGVQRRSAAGRETWASFQESDTTSTGLCRRRSNIAAVSLIWTSDGRLASLPRC